MLNDTRVRNAKRADRPIKLSDRGGLHLLIQPNGSKLWRLAYRFGGKQKTLAIGVYPTVTLEARAWETRRSQETARRSYRSLDAPPVGKACALAYAMEPGAPPARARPLWSWRGCQRPARRAWLPRSPSQAPRRSCSWRRRYAQLAFPSGPKARAVSRRRPVVASSLCRLPRDRPGERRRASPGWCRRWGHDASGGRCR